MTDELTNSSWGEALAVYGSFEGPEWRHIRAFRNLVAEIGAHGSASG